MRAFDRILAYFSSDRQFRLQLEHILGYNPKHLPFYRQALMHRSGPKDVIDNNERLEFLGDAILGAVIAEYLFKKYPYQPEGYLTELRSKIVRRETMNNVAMRMGINKLVQYNQSDQGLSRSHIFGNALEALIGAVFLDQGFEKTKRFIIHQLVRQYIDIDTLDATNSNFKNQFLTWAQKQNYAVTFETLEEKVEGSRRLFTVGIKLNGELFESGNGYNKKDAGQVASQKALEKVTAGRTALPKTDAPPDEQ